MPHNSPNYSVNLPSYAANSASYAANPVSLLTNQRVQNSKQALNQNDIL
jgi:hypothetical protein